MKIISFLVVLSFIVHSTNGICQVIDKLSTTSVMLIEKDEHRSWVSGETFNSGKAKVLHYGINFGSHEINLPAYSKVIFNLLNGVKVSFTLMEESKIESGKIDFSFALSDQNLEKLKSSPVEKIIIQYGNKFIEESVNENNSVNIIKVLTLIDK